MRAWQAKLHEGTQANPKAQGDLKEAWAEAKIAAGKLETASSEDWEGAKSSFENATHKLGASWQWCFSDEAIVPRGSCGVHATRRHRRAVSASTGMPHDTAAR
jgi:hypothetical protein